MSRRSGIDWDALDLRDTVWIGYTYYVDEVRESMTMTLLGGIGGMREVPPTASEATDRALGRHARGDAADALSAQSQRELEQSEPAVNG